MQTHQIHRMGERVVWFVDESDGRSCTMGVRTEVPEWRTVLCQSCHRPLSTITHEEPMWHSCMHKLYCGACFPQLKEELCARWDEMRVEPHRLNRLCREIVEHRRFEDVRESYLRAQAEKENWQLRRIWRHLHKGDEL